MLVYYFVDLFTEYEMKRVVNYVGNYISHDCEHCVCCFHLIHIIANWTLGVEGVEALFVIPLNLRNRIPRHLFFSKGMHPHYL